MPALRLGNANSPLRAMSGASPYAAAHSSACATTELSSGMPVLPSPDAARRAEPVLSLEEATMHGIIYIVGLIVVIMFILSFLGLR
jgi:hypothetical protein